MWAPPIAAKAATGATSLDPVERFAVWLGRAINEHPASKRAQELFLRSVAYSWIRASLARRMYAVGLEELARLTSDTGVLLVSNHRSFFDLYAIMLAIWMGKVPWARRIYFPVRANFFYDQPLGILTNLVVGAGVMYPPIYRSRERAQFNRDAIRRISELLQTRNALVGLHPEGTRNKEADPYQLLAAQPGVGQVALAAKCLVIPIFINGLSNSISGDIRSNYRKGIRRTNPIICIFGKPVELADLSAQTPRLAICKHAADRMNHDIQLLGEQERVLRLRCAQGQVSDDDPSWLSNRRNGLFYIPRG